METQFLHIYLFCVRKDFQQLFRGIKCSKKFKTSRFVDKILVSLICLFADDIYLYWKANKEKIFQVLEQLKIFEAASGQKVNLLNLKFKRNTI